MAEVAVCSSVCVSHLALLRAKEEEKEKLNQKKINNCLFDSILGFLKSPDILKNG
jgi:hypothetical protein